MSSTRQWLGLVVFISICLAAAGVGAMFTASSVNGWYTTLRKPSWNPPNQVFGPVWTMLYLCMAIAAWLVWRREGLSGAAIPLTIFAVQLILNVAWSGLFFGIQRPWLAFADILLLLVAITLTMISFSRVSPSAGWLLTPYLVWVTFAAALNLTLARMNS